MSQLSDAIDKMVDSGLLIRDGGFIRLGPLDLKSAGPELQVLTKKYGNFQGYEAEILARIPPLLYASGPLTLQMIEYVLSQTGIIPE